MKKTIVFIFIFLGVLIMSSESVLALPSSVVIDCDDTPVGRDVIFCAFYVEDEASGTINDVLDVIGIDDLTWQTFNETRHEIDSGDDTDLIQLGNNAVFQLNWTVPSPGQSYTTVVKVIDTQFLGGDDIIYTADQTYVPSSILNSTEQINVSSPDITVNVNSTQVGEGIASGICQSPAFIICTERFRNHYDGFFFNNLLGGFL